MYYFIFVYTITEKCSKSDRIDHNSSKCLACGGQFSIILSSELNSYHTCYSDGKSALNKTENQKIATTKKSPAAGSLVCFPQ